MPKPDTKPNKDKKDKDREKLKKAKHLETVEVSADGSITAGTTVAEFDTALIRKNTLRTS